MIIFDLDGTLADCEHRRHFVDSDHFENLKRAFLQGNITLNEYKKQWKPNWKAFFEACDKDAPIEPVIDIFMKCVVTNKVEIWSGRCESVRQKTLEWLDKHLNVNIDEFTLRMRPIGDSTPDDELKERWLDEYITENIAEKLELGREFDLTEATRPIEMVFDDRPKVVAMWRRRGIFVFDCNQTGKEF